jgi:hypothetical protein
MIIFYDRHKKHTVKNLLKLEEAAQLGFCIYALSLFHVSWWVYFVLVLGPDISMLGYLVGNRFGGACYNLLHHKGIAVAVFVVGLMVDQSMLQIAGIVLFGHSSMDRMFGYGLKYNTGFGNTHLGRIGKSKKPRDNFEKLFIEK